MYLLKNYWNFTQPLASHADVYRLVTRSSPRLLNGAITSIRWRLAFVLKEPIVNPLLSACQVDSFQFRLPCALKYARFYDKIRY